MQETIFIGQVADGQIDSWKSKFKQGIYALEVGGHIAYFKNPCRAEINCAMSKADREKTLEMYEELAQLTFIGGSEHVLTDDELFLGICQELGLKLEGKKATLVNL